MSIKTKNVVGRRELRFKSFDDLLADAERLANGNVKMLGNWSLAQIFSHLAAGIHSNVDGSTFKAPLFFRLMAPLMKKKFVYGGIPPGFQIPKEAQAQFLPPNEVETEAALGELRKAIERFNSADKLAAHPMFGKLSKAELEQFQLRHGEMHLSFAVPAEG